EQQRDDRGGETGHRGPPALDGPLVPLAGAGGDGRAEASGGRADGQDRGSPTVTGMRASTFPILGDEGNSQIGTSGPRGRGTFGWVWCGPVGTRRRVIP